MMSGSKFAAATLATAFVALAVGATASASAQTPSGPGGGDALEAFVDDAIGTDQLEVILAFDASESMWPVIRTARAAATVFVQSMPPNVRIGVESFGDTVEVLAAPTTDHELVISQINSIAPSGQTALYDAVISASQHFSPAVEHRVIVLVSDGKDDGSTQTLDGAVWASAYTQIEAISLTSPETDLDSLTALGNVTSADDPAGLTAAFARVSGLIEEVIATTTTTSTTTTTTTTTTTSPSTTVAAPPPIVAAAPPVAPASERSTTPLWLGGIALFSALLLLGLALVPRDRVSRARLGVAKPRRVSDFGLRTTTAIEDTLERYGKSADLGQTLSIADISMKPAEFVSVAVLVALVAGLVGLLLGGPVIALLLFGATCLFVGFVVRFKKARRQAAFADQLPDVLQLITTALRSGYGITQAIESVGEEAEEPARSEFAHVLVQTRLGRDLSEGLYELAGRMGSKDLAWVVAAIDINRETGGNLSEILATVSTTIRERSRVARQVRTLTAEGRLSARILTALPFLMLLWQWRVNPDNMALLTSGIGLVALVVAGILMVLGSLWVRKVVNSVAL